MEFLRDGVDLQAIGGRALAGDAHLFEEATTPAKIRNYLDSTKVQLLTSQSIRLYSSFPAWILCCIGARKIERDETSAGHVVKRT
jgi:hypothetical protein